MSFQSTLLSRRKTIALLAGAAVFAFARPARAQVSMPEPGSPTRKQILDGLRPTVEKEIGGRVEFVVNQMRAMRVDGRDWAYVIVRPQRPGGGKIDWSKTKFREAWTADQMSDLVLALLRKDGDDWRVIEYAIGPTDVASEAWIEPHHLPRKLFFDE